MARKYQRHTLEFKRQAVAQMAACSSIRSLAKQLGVQRRLLYRWKEEIEEAPKGGRQPEAAETAVVGELKQKVHRLEAMLGQKTLEASFFRGALQKVEARRQKQEPVGGTGSTTTSGQ